MPSIEIVVGENAKMWRPASISVVDVFSAHENGPLIMAIVPLGSEAVPETVDIMVTNANRQKIAAIQESDKQIAIVPKNERRFELRSIPNVALHGVRGLG